MTTHIMLDLETMGIGNEAAIVSIGAVKFDPMGSGINDAFYVGVDLSSATACGLKIDGSTVLWWLDAERDAARKSLMVSDFIDLPEALDGFAQWYGESSLPTWGNGATFDNVVMRNAFNRVGLRCPWSYKHDRCFRTFKNLAPEIESPNVGILHQALNDATAQAQHMQLVVKHLGITAQ